MVSAKDVILELGHCISHANEYASGTTKFHSHKIDGKLIVHHDHVIIKKIEKAIDKATNNAQNQDTEYELQTVKLLNFDQIKLINVVDNQRLQNYNFKDLEYYYNLKFDQFHNQFPTPPPQSSIV